MARRGRPCVRLTLNAEQRAELQRRVRAGTSCQRDGLRARIILASEDGGSAAVVARRVGVHPRTVERWRDRFRCHGLRGLHDQPRPGAPPKFAPVTRLELIALACEPVERHEGKTTRTLTELVDEAVARGLVAGIGWSSYQRLLAASDLRPHRVQSWLHSPDPQFREKVTAITDLYLRPPVGAVVLSIDEKTGMQALERRFPDRPPAPGRRRRREFEYRRHGTQSLLCAFEVHRGRVVADCGATRTAADLVRFMERLAALYPTETVHVIWDNLNIHFDGADQRWTAFNARHGHRFVFHYTPKHASWVNQVELFFSILQRQCLRDASVHSIEELRTVVLEFIAGWNRDRAHPFRWTFTGYPLQTGATVASPTAA
ncbi:MAG TPA: IS630 family transposase [Methylomirabilota bacterium]|nr:IS630 family transposase [Methylomirabilota bacterium]